MCTHYWIIDPPQSKYSHGVCRYCGEDRDRFPNSLEAAVSLLGIHPFKHDGGFTPLPQDIEEAEACLSR